MVREIAPFVTLFCCGEDHEKVLDGVAKVEKNNMRQMRKSPGQLGGVLKNRSYPSSRPLRRCFYSNYKRPGPGPGHIKANCLQRRKDSGEFSVKNDKKNRFTSVDK